MCKTEKSAKKRWDAVNVRQIKIDFMKHTEADMLDWLDSQPAKATYIKRLIREDMARQKSEYDIDLDSEN